MDPAHLCKPLILTRREAQLLLVAAGERLKRMTSSLASGVITGAEVDRRIEIWRQIIAKLDACLEEQKG